MYPNEEEKPRIGEKLNKPSVLTFTKCIYWKSFLKAKEAINHNKVLKNLKKSCEKQGSHLIGYDSESGTWIMKVNQNILV